MKTCGGCEFYKAAEDDSGNVITEDFYDLWGHCCAPVPMSLKNSNTNNVDFNQKAKKCEMFSKK